MFVFDSIEGWIDDRWKVQLKIGCIVYEVNEFVRMRFEFVGVEGYRERHMGESSMYGWLVQTKQIAKHLPELFLLRYLIPLPPQ